MEGRIKFAGSPWPEGHPIKLFRWQAERRGDEVWFGFHLETEDYSFERRLDDDGGAEFTSDWDAPIVWGNYHNCIISSNEWHAGGFLACSAHEYGVDSIDGLSVRVDPLPVDLSEGSENRAFHIYLLGHDAVADHRIAFSRLAGTDLFNVSWQGKIALAYAGDFEPKYSFDAQIRGASLPTLASGT